jgi:CRP-like cAMP-binding protein
MTDDAAGTPPGPGLPPGLGDLAGHAFLRGMPEDSIATLAEFCRVAVAEAGHRFFDEGGMASKFWLVRSGHVALDLHVPGRSRLIVETLGPGDLLGLSWFTTPFRWQFGAVAVQKTSSFELDAAAVRAACDADPALGYQFLCRLMAAASGRLQASRIRMLDLYAAPVPPRETP